MVILALILLPTITKVVRRNSINFTALTISVKVAVNGIVTFVTVVVLMNHHLIP